MVTNPAAHSFKPPCSSAVVMAAQLALNGADYLKQVNLSTTSSTVCGVGRLARFSAFLLTHQKYPTIAGPGRSAACPASSILSWQGNWSTPVWGIEDKLPFFHANSTLVGDWTDITCFPLWLTGNGYGKFLLGPIKTRGFA